MIEIYARHQSYKVVSPDHKVKEAYRKFLEQYTQKETVYDPRTRRNVTETMYVYKAGNPFENEMFIHHNAIANFIGCLRAEGVEFTDINMVNVKNIYTKVPMKYKAVFPPKGYQVKYEAAILKDDKLPAKLVDLQMGKGKMVGVSTPIRLPVCSGHPELPAVKKIGDVVVGEMVLGADGLPTKVTAVYPQGKKALYKMTLEDGRVTYSGKEHLWKVYNDNMCNGDGEVLSTEDMMSSLEETNFYLQNIVSEQHDDILLEIAPYTIGELVSGKGTISNRYKQYIHQFAIMSGWTTENKLERIPELYKNGSVKQRLMVIRGIFDVSAEIVGGQVVYKSTHKELVLDVQTVLYSLGASVTLSLDDTTGEYKLVIFYRFAELLFRGKELMLTAIRQIGSKKHLYNKILSIEYSHDEEAVCISVDNEDKLYVINDFVPTHNTFIAAKTISTITYRTLLLLLPSYVKKWIADLAFHFELGPKEIVTINGRAELISFLENDDGTAVFVLLSNRTFLNFITEYENSMSASVFDSPILPSDICAKHNFGMVLVDEVHREVYSVYKALLYLDPALFLGLSATFNVPGWKKFIHNLMFDDKSRLSLLEYDAYAEVYSIAYNVDFPKRLERGATRARGYNHIEFEKAILRNRYLKHNYFKLIIYYIDKFYKAGYKPNDKAIVFCSTKHMCTELTAYIDKTYQTLNIKRFIAGDPQTNLYDSDIRVSTIKSAGEAIDIDQLTFGLLSVAIGSPVANEQALGRLREIKGRSVVYNYLYCNDLKAHRKYHYSKLETFVGKVKFIQGLVYPKTLSSTSMD